jgi:lipoprotein-releasing system ATP-binding protein
MYNVIMSAKEIFKSYSQGAGELEILHGISLDIFRGESLGIVGSSGCGKSTLMHILGTLDRPQKGSLFFGGTDLWSLSDEELSSFRNQKMGFVFQFHHLLSEFSALENIMIPMRIAGENIGVAQGKAEALLHEVGLESRGQHFPHQLSGGELQRVAIARALINQPEILFADEPTGNLDSRNSQLIQNLFFELQSRRGLTLVVVTHDAQFASRFSRVQRMRDGKWV